MSKLETITISLDRQTLDSIRKLAQLNYRSINKQIQFIISLGLKSMEVK
jgi:hypothetical protein